MPDFLKDLARASARRAAAARARCPRWEILRRVRDLPPPAKLRLDPSGFDLIAEIKLRSPSRGRLAVPGKDVLRFVRRAACAYAEGGAAAVSVLTEPDRFDGTLSHLESVAGAVRLPVIRKDFLVDPYQILEARLAGASGVLLIAKLLEEPLLERMLDACAEAGLFVLLEACDREDAGRIARLLESRREGGPDVLAGANARDLRCLSVRRDRLEALLPHLPAGFPKVAESGLETAEDAARAASVGYRLVLVGTALMRSPAPDRLAATLVRAGRAAAAPPAPEGA